MSKSKTQVFDLYQLSFQASINCWRAASARFSLFATRPLFDQILVEESLNMVSEKMTLSIELGEILSSSDNPHENYRQALESINQKAIANLNRLTGGDHNA